ncbi:50S ribosomal protein L22, partial [Candidatus Peregrinibacteria bacterium]|nr:50S ribosomal protein L22 [Candidatus Peregrinibacteria bacterium]
FLLLTSYFLLLVKALLRSARIAPKKANIIARMVRGMSVPEAQSLLSRTQKKAARLFEGLLASAVANAAHNDRQDTQVLVVKEVIVNQGSSLRRGVPMARGRVRPMRKFLSHLSVTLGVQAEGAEEGSSKKKQEVRSKNKVSPVPYGSES